MASTASRAGSGGRPARPDGTPVGRTLWRTFGIQLALLATACGLGLAGLLVDAANYGHLNQISAARSTNRLVLASVTAAATTVDNRLMAGPAPGGPAGASPTLYNSARSAFVQNAATGLSQAEFNRTVSGLWVAQVAAGSHYLDSYADPALAGSAPSQAEGDTLLNRFRAANTAVANYLASLRQSTVDRGTSQRRLFIIGVFALLVAGGTLATFFTIRATRAVVRPLAGIREALTQLAVGTLTVRAPVAGPAEMRAVARSMNNLADLAAVFQSDAATRARGDEAVREVVAAVARSLNPDEVLAAAVRALGEALHADRAFFWALDGDDLLPVTIEWSAPGLEPAAPHSKGATGLGRRLEPSDDVVVVRDIERGTVILPVAITEFMRLTGDRAGAFARVHDGSDVFGWLSVQTRRTRRWEPAEQETIATAAREIGIAMRRARAYRQEVAAVERLTELDRERDAFVHTVTHEMRTPMTSVAGYVGLLTESGAEPLTDDQRKMLVVIGRNARHVQDLIDDLLTLARVTSPDFAVDPKPVALGPIIDEACQMIAPTARIREVTVVRETGADDARIRGDALQLGRVVLNLVSNAVKYTPAGGTVTITTTQREPTDGSGTGTGTGAGDEAEGATVALAVRDTGVGIPAAEQGRLFTRFFRASNALRDGIPGTGLGLSLVAAVVRAHGGTVEVASEENVGSTFTIRLPRA